MPRMLQGTDGLDATWLSEVLGTRVAAAQVTPIAAGEGFMSHLARVYLTYEDGDAEGGLPETVVAKVPTDEPGSVALGQMLHLWEREARFYLDVAPRLPVRTARCYYAGGDEASGLWSLLLEDLGGLRLGDQVAGATPQQAATAMDWLGRFHGSAANEPALQDLPWLPDVATDEMYQALQPMLDAVWPRFVELYGDYCPGDTLAIVDRARTRLTEALCESPSPPTVIHADYRLDNLFFGDDGELVAIDWQAPAIGQGLYDVTYFLTGNLTVDRRRDLEGELLERWSEGVRAAGGTTLEGAELWREYRRMVLVAMTISALLMGQLDITVNERAVELGRQTIERMYTAGMDLEVDGLLDA